MNVRSLANESTHSPRSDGLVDSGVEFFKSAVAEQQILLMHRAPPELVENQLARPAQRTRPKRPSTRPLLKAEEEGLLRAANLLVLAMSRHPEVSRSVR